MKFFLLARESSGELTLLSSAAFDTRADALNSLESLTAEPDFAFWGAELFVMDLDSATPVLLVRPSQTVGELESLVEEEVAAALDADDVSDTEALAELIASVEDEMPELESVEP
ncbi:MAG: hypothetical protein HY876_10400, partial [Coriobacteriales bacterium]|nr:hypothetical protein [Coriobacteriales bacterium]